MTRTTFVSLLCALLVAGCGGGSTTNDPRSVADGFAHAIAGSDWGKACSLMSTEAKSQLLIAAAFTGKGGTCEKTLESMVAFLDPADREKMKDARVTLLKVSGDRATVRYSSDSKSDGPTYLVQKNGHWLIDKDPEDQ